MSYALIIADNTLQNVIIIIIIIIGRYWPKNSVNIKFDIYSQISKIRIVAIFVIFDLQTEFNA
jgi:hypothetical protein